MGLSDAGGGWQGWECRRCGARNLEAVARHELSRAERAALAADDPDAAAGRGYRTAPPPHVRCRRCGVGYRATAGLRSAPSDVQ